MTKRVIIIGAGEAGRMVVREIDAAAQKDFDILGFLDDDPALGGRLVEGRPVMGPVEDLASVALEKGVHEAIVAVPTGTREFVRRVIALCRDARISCKIVPGVIEIIRGPVRLEQVRDVHPEDLLGRESAEFDESALRESLAGRRVLVTGAGGSIGGELCRQIGRFGLSELQILGRGENQIFDIEHQLRTLYPSLELRAIIADIRDPNSVDRVIRRMKPDYVYHAAAHKHVHYMEAYPEEAVINNILGTDHLIRAARRWQVERLVMISTDKAVRPAGVMGATKRIAEFLMTDYASGGDVPRLITVRFGNVLGSRGSVVPLFMSQIRAGGPVTVSHPDATRFFMSLREACMLVVQASLMGAGGEIFVLRMGTPVKIVDMAKDLIALHGLRANIDVGIEIVGLRPGEKLHEDLTVEGEDVSESAHERILTARAVLPDGWRREDALGELSRLAAEGNSRGIREYLRKIIPDARLGTDADDTVSGAAAGRPDAEDGGGETGRGSHRAGK